MKCKTFKIHLAEETRNFEEVKFNKFLENIAVRQTFAEIVNNEYWSILVFYEDLNASFQAEDNIPIVSHPTKSAILNPKSEIEKPAPEPIVLSPEQEQKFNALKQWRNERANADGLPAYMIAHNESLMQIAFSDIKTPEDLIGIKGFGEKRAQKYGDEILSILRARE